MYTFVPLPSLLVYGGIAPLVLRLTLGLTLFYFGYKKIKGSGDSSGSNSKIYGLIEIVIGTFLVIGLFTQLCALLNAVILIIKLVYKGTEKKLLSDGINYYILLLTIALALAFVAPGMWAVDSLL